MRRAVFPRFRGPPPGGGFGERVRRVAGATTSFHGFVRPFWRRLRRSILVPDIVLRIASCRSQARSSILDVAFGSVKGVGRDRVPGSGSWACAVFARRASAKVRFPRGAGILPGLRFARRETAAAPRLRPSPWGMERAAGSSRARGSAAAIDPVCGGDRGRLKFVRSFILLLTLPVFYHRYRYMFGYIVFHYQKLYNKLSM